MEEEKKIIESLDNKQVEVEERYGLVKFLLVAVMVVLIGRSFYLQIVRGSNLHLQAEDNRVSLVPQLAPRGIIYDRHGQQMVENIASTDLVLDPLIMPGVEHEASLVDGLVKYLEMEPSEVKAVLNEARQQTKTVLLKKAIDHEMVIELEGALATLPGVRIVSSTVRNYMHPHALSHVLGYTGMASAEELAEKEYLIMNEVTGKAGIEKQYDQVLRGKPGASYIEVNAAGHPQKELDKDEPVPGQDMQLSIDARLQNFIFSLLAERNMPGSVVALEPGTGAVVALVNYPAYDPNVFSQPGRHSEANKVLSDERQPLFNRAIGGTYAPGSTIKPLIAAAGLQEGVISSSTSFLSTGGINIGQWSFPDWKTGGHGQTDVRKAIAESVNTFFYLLSGGDEGFRGLGVNRINKYLKGFGWGSETGIDLPNEAAGLLPSPKWKEDTKNERWYVGDTYHMGIGQGDVLVTPIQVAVTTVAIANGGMIYEPTLQMSGAEAKGERVRKSPVSKGHLQTVREGMRQAVTQGSARALANLPLPLAGKTGTAQYGSEEDETHAWFTSFGPWQEPELVVTVLLERGGRGDVDAVPVAKEVWQWWAEQQ